MKQHGTDYSYVNTLASKVGAVFYLDPGPTPGTSLAYWGPDLSKMFGGTQPALSINFDGTTNIDSLSFSYDGTLATQLPRHHHRAEHQDSDPDPGAEHRSDEGAAWRRTRRPR